MSHDLEIDSTGMASMAFNAQFGDPWHSLGTPIDGNMTIEQALAACRGDYIVTKQPLKAVAPTFLADGEIVEGLEVDVKGKIATMRINPITGLPQVLGILGSGYGVVQNQTVMEKAFAVVGAAEDSAHIDTAGVILDGTRFFSYIRLDDLVIDPVGINDVIERGLAVYTSHDGTVAVTYAFTDVRAVCRNTITFGVNNAKRLFKAKHTRGVDGAMDEAQKVLGVSTAWADDFRDTANKLLAVKFTEDRFESVLNSVFPTPPTPTDRQKRSAEKTRTEVRSTFANTRNAGSFGQSGWTMYNAIVEYLDHHRGGDEEKRAVATMTPGSWVDKRKQVAAGRILSLV